MKKNSPLNHLRVLITAGPTREWMDPVRFLSNPSTGKMGLTIAEVFQKNGADVTVVLGPSAERVPAGVTVIPVESARDMFAAVREKLPGSHVFIGTAAVGDWRFDRIGRKKNKKPSGNVLDIRLVKNPDIVAWVGSRKQTNPALMVIGFALETHHALVNASKKRRDKNLDLIVVNDPSTFGSEKISATLLHRDASTHVLGAVSKQTLAKKILGCVLQWNKTTSVL